MISFFKDRKRVITDRTGKVPYLIRYYIFLKDRKKFPFNITLHKVLVSDEPTLHDHPWNWGAMILKGGYWEHIPIISQEGAVVGSTRVWRGPGSIRFRKAKDLHWLELEKDKDGNEIYIEVKSTKGQSINSLDITENEWNAAVKEKDKFYIYIVNNALTEKIKIFEKIQNPKKLVDEKKINLSTSVFELKL